MRILFHGPGLAISKPQVNIQPIFGTQSTTISTFAELKLSHQLTGNRGNMIHAEAPAKLFEHDVKKSIYGNVATLQRSLGDSFADQMEENFDLIIISMANFIRTDHDGQHLLAPLRALNGRVKFMVLGAGLQGNPDPRNMIPSNLDLIAMFNEQAEVFAVRGRETALWLRKHGYENATIIGCPSLYAYPDSIMSLDYAAARARAENARIMTAGYLKQTENTLHPRGRELVKAFQGLKASYVMQDEVFTFSGLQTTPRAFNEGRCEVDKAVLEDYLKGYGVDNLPFDRYSYFMETSGWRQAAMAHDVFIGDRFHGGVAALQSGIPAIFLSHDNRVAELTSFFDLPALSTKEFARLGLRQTLETHLSDDAERKFKEKYLLLHKRFREFFAGHGLKVHPQPPGSPDTAPAPNPSKAQGGTITQPVRTVSEKIEFSIGKDDHIRIGDVYGKYHFSDISKPLVITFSHLGGSVSEDDMQAMKSPWAFDYLRRKNINCLCFASVRGKNKFYRDQTFIDALDKISAALPNFPNRLGYGTSMGAYAVSAFSGPLNISRLLLASPISTRDPKINYWDLAAKRSLPSFKFDWNGKYSDGAETTAGGYVIYDPLYGLDAQHARRFESLTPLKMPGAGHSGVDLLAQMKILDWVFSSFFEGHIDKPSYYQKIRARKSLASYYRGLLGKENTQITPARRQVVKNYLEKQRPNILKGIPDQIWGLDQASPRQVKQSAIPKSKDDITVISFPTSGSSTAEQSSNLLDRIRRLIGQ
ncbi:polysaccharide pyruvyl transferase family protein [Paracoccus sp. (in: a-proteobacteria)]|uniref:polysaccharide pyruvyl transferase family protein n=1 Tax=Paracoccus sp. TaxID=267 RepID=UPI00333E9AB4